MKSFVSIFKGAHSIRFCIRFICFLLLVQTVVSCSKSEDVDSGTAAMNIDLEGIDLDAESDLQLASASSTEIQQVSVPLTHALQIVAELSPVVSGTGVTEKRASTGRSMTTASSSTNSSVLETGVQYRLVVYDASNNYVTDKVYVKGSENSDVFYLEVGKSYTFISFSINSKTSVPAVDTSKKLSDLTLTNIDGNANFMYFKKTVTMVKGENYLGIKLKHLFSEITTTINASALTGNIMNCVAQIAPHYATIAVKLTDGTLVGSGNAGNKTMSFAAFGGKTAVSTATRLAHPATTTGAITLSSIQVGSITKTNLVLNNLTINPGVRYTLKLTLQAAGVNGIDIGGYLWAPGNLTYNNTTKAYSFEKDQSVAGEYWIYNWLLPKRYQTEQNWEVQQSIANTYKSDRDPCRKVTSNGGGWRTPTSTEMQTLVNSGTRFAKYGTVSGIYFGTTNTPSTANKDNFVFFANTGYSDMNGGGVKEVGNEGRFWSATISPNSHHAYGMWFREGWNNYMNLGAEYVLEGRSVRCVKNK